LLGHQSVPARDFRHNGTRSKRLFDYPRFIVRRELPPPSRTRDHLDPPQGRLRLKRMVKLRHKPISDSEIAHSLAGAVRERWGQNSAYDSIRVSYLLGAPQSAWIMDNIAGFGPGRACYASSAPIFDRAQNAAIHNRVIANRGNRPVLDDRQLIPPE
jgi:hypothetical protein